MKFSTQTLSMLLTLLLALCLCIGLVSCNGDQPADQPTTATTTVATTTTAADNGAPEPVSVKITFKVVHKDGTSKSFEVSTTESMVGPALVKEGLISGEASEYGLYVKVVDGETADYDVDQSYWAFYISDQMAETGVDSTPVTDGGVYSFVYTKPEPAKATFTFKVTHADGTVKTFEVKTDAETVGAALLAQGLISGDVGDYGLYVKVVDGETADYDVDQSYWAFYIGDQMAETCVDSTPVTDGGVYGFVYSK